MLHNISLYPGLTEEQLCRFFPEKEATAKTLLAHMLKEGRIFCAGNDRYYANREVQSNADKDLSRCVWVLLDFIDQVEYHTVGEFPAAILCFANGELYEIVPIPQGKETMICQLLHQPLPAVLALVYGDEACHTPDYTGKVGVHIALPRLVDDVKHLDVALTAILLVQFVCRFDAVDFPGCPDAVIGKFHTGIRRDPHKVKCIRVFGR